MNVHIEALVKNFPGGRRLFNRLNLDLSANEFVAIVGPSGCGKSTLLRLISGIDSVSEGKINISPEKTKIGFVFQEPRLLPWRTVRENLLLPAEIKAAYFSEEKIVAAMALVRLNRSVLDLFPHQLSGGMKMRVALSRALMSEPDLLLMDEPLAALDESTRQFLQEEVARIHQSRASLTVLVTHSLSEAVFLADRIVILQANGEIQAEIKTDLPRPRLESLRGQVEFSRLVLELQQRFRNLLAEETALQ